MSNGAKFGILGAAVGVVLTLIIASMWIGASNDEVHLRNLAAAEQDKCKLVHDNVWKTIKQKGGVTEGAYDKFREVFKDIFSERYQGGGGSLAKVITENNPTFDMSLYQDLLRTIEAKRQEYMVAQSKLRDIKNSHDDLRGSFPSSIFVGGRPELKIILVTSDTTESVYGSGRDNDIETFPSKNK